MKKHIFCAAVIAVTAFGVMKTTDVNKNSKMSYLQLENVEAMANPEWLMGEGSYFPRATTPVLKRSTTTTHTTSNGTSNSNQKTNTNKVEGTAEASILGKGASVDAEHGTSKSKSDGSTQQSTTEIKTVENVYVLPCVGSDGSLCEDRLF